MKDKKQEFLGKIKKKAKKLVKKMGLKNISDILDKIRQEYLNGIKDFVSDPQQSWKPFKGKLLEEIIIDEIKEEVEKKWIESNKR